MKYNFNVEINGYKLGVAVDKPSYWGIYKMALKPFSVETINAREALSHAYYALTHSGRIQSQFLKGKSVRL
ncbi:MAG: hypothetical protein P4L49_07120 [Desulfosporosinus sp.]|nr:hypothetical protein [Desulfosporosinus sp.]